MHDLYTRTNLECSRLITQNYSTSFTLGIKTLHKQLRLPIYAIYGFVRYADEIVDTFHDFDRQELLDRFKKDTYLALEEKISLNPVLHSFQLIVHEYDIDRKLIDAFLKSMEMDLTKETYTLSQYQEYIYGSAEVVGLMCLHVFCEGDKQLYEHLKEPAKRLGAAFQKVNFLRDIKSDFDERGRVYFPKVDFNAFTREDKKQIEEDIQLDFKVALEGIRKLPHSSRGGVYLAYVYYTKLFEKIQHTSPRKILQERIRVPDAIKLMLLTKTLVLSRLNAI
ncbi:MAG: phytoene/squalene synthase family protein [Cyclobacteriaceae bacterium]|nr:phytoene/squalene synthase family protein [Cyclobacteriaceae bacterium SS2]